jgi:hypothetical protein
MTPQEFVNKWKESTLNERSAAQSHFYGLCHLLSVETPTNADRTGQFVTFEKGASKTGDGWADLLKRGCFAWEYKGKYKDLAAALKQLKLYQGALDNPPLLIVCDMEKIAGVPGLDQYSPSRDGLHAGLHSRWPEARRLEEGLLGKAP